MRNFYVIDEGMLNELSSKIMKLEIVTDNILYKNMIKENLKKELESLRRLQDGLDSAETLDSILKRIKDGDIYCCDNSCHDGCSTLSYGSCKRTGGA